MEHLDQWKRDSIEKELHRFLHTSVKDEINQHLRTDVLSFMNFILIYWKGLLEYLQDLYEDTVKNVPAYKEFLQQNNAPLSINSMSEFKSLPLMDKSNYLKKFSLHQICKRIRQILTLLIINRRNFG